ncbi:hypothetical protein VNO78_21855 [Psophocarpus tetragonolobus]|uniref:Uncharacterized protein n=1 Tax=Psophocarpus tetragonolobus TaxID=3891 RepID=A0AAN9SFW3_PSOTE
MLLLWLKSHRAFRILVRYLFWFLANLEIEVFLFSSFVSLRVALTSRNVKTLQLRTPSFECLIQKMDTLSPVNAVLENIIDNLEGTFSESIHLHDALSEHASEGDHIGNCDVGEGNLGGDFELQETKLEIQCLKECSTFPYSLSSSDEEVDASPSKQSPHQNHTCLVSF